jgi:hypothetical protein
MTPEGDKISQCLPPLHALSLPLDAQGVRALPLSSALHHDLQSIKLNFRATFGLPQSLLLELPCPRLLRRYQREILISRAAVQVESRVEGPTAQRIASKVYDVGKKCLFYCLHILIPEQSRSSSSSSSCSSSSTPPHSLSLSLSLSLCPSPRRPQPPAPPCPPLPFLFHSLTVPRLLASFLRMKTARAQYFPSDI